MPACTYMPNINRNICSDYPTAVLPLTTAIEVLLRLKIRRLEYKHHLFCHQTLDIRVNLIWSVVGKTLTK